MEGPDIVAMRKRLEDLTRLLQARSEEFERMGEFSEAKNAAFKELQKRHELLMREVAQAERAGDVGRIIAARMRRDVDALFEGLQQFEDRVHAEAVRRVQSKEVTET
jgi:predicted nuclease with TOPRIM domain